MPLTEHFLSLQYASALPEGKMAAETWKSRKVGWTLFLFQLFAGLASALLSCPGSNSTYYATSNGTYIIECGMDRSGANMPGSPTYVASLEACIGLCVNNTGCLDVSWVNSSTLGPCYFKSTVGTTVTYNTVWGARWLGNVAISSSSSSAFPTTTTTTTTTTSSSSRWVLYLFYTE